MPGKFIVFEGNDGSGKGTQFERAIKALQAEGRTVARFDFPQYGQKSAALVEEYLNGKYGEVSEVSPQAATLFYAVDRFAASFKIREALNAGTIVLANRFTPSNFAYHAAKLKTEEERQTFLFWLEELEYGLLKLPRPDLVILLHVPVKISYELIAKKEERAYIEDGKKRDIHESNFAFLKTVEECYLQLAKHDATVRTIECAPKGSILPIEEISALVLEEIKKVV